ncbi:MAG: tyrosine-type recombinase/integrase [Planctomycetota bacterium]
MRQFCAPLAGFFWFVPHTIAVQLLKKTGNLRLVQKQLGHASPATTANMYADISFEDMQNGVTGLYQ